MIRIGVRAYIPALSPEEFRAIKAAEEEAVNNGHRWMETEGGFWHHASDGDLSILTRKCCLCHRRITVDANGQVGGSAVVFKCRESRYGLAERLVQVGVFPQGSYYKGRKGIR